MRSGGVVLLASYAVIIAAVNLMNPLIPAYQVNGGLSASAVAWVYGSYLLCLLPIMAALSHPRLQLRPGRVLIAALVITVIADLAMSSGKLAGLLGGRVIMAIAVGFGTGATAQLLIAHSRASSSGMLAGANIVGAAIGTMGAAASGLWSPRPLTDAYVGHALITGALCILCWDRYGAARNMQPVSGSSSPLGPPPAQIRTGPGILMGTVAFAAAALVLVAVPAAYLGDRRDNIGATTGLVLILLLGAAGGQLGAQCSRALARGGVLACIAGILVCAAGIRMGDPWLVALGCLVAGLGYGSSYRIAFELTTRGLTGRRQGAAATRFSAVLYAAAAGTVIANGYLSDRLSAGTAVWICAGGLLITGAFALGALARLPRFL